MKRSIIGAAVLFFASLSGLASAAPVTSASLSGGNAVWTIGQNGALGLNVIDANLGGQTDAFDNALAFQVGGFAYSSGANFDLSGQTVTGNMASIAGLNVFVQYYADASSPTLRTLITLSNTGAGSVSTTVRLQNNVGSDSATRTIATSSGDTAFTAADRWIITDDDNGSGGDPANTHVLWGSNGQAPANVGLTVFSASGTQGVLADFALDIAAGTTESLMFFNQLYTSGSAAQAGVVGFNDLTSTNPLLAGLSPAQLSQIQNWEFEAQAVPEPSVIALMGLGLAGLRLSRRTSKSGRRAA
ncbi:MAG: PEP-CTERM sorting domain-containing protein [Lysobacteraceae bacterium]|nr:MAG: PEP-CTERM sorting domain-containing protein [Xanthomonadaceae bacterium]